MAISNKAIFLQLIHILVDETRPDAPMTKRALMEKCEAIGCSISESTFDKAIRDMAQAGIIIRRKLPSDVERGPYLYWYDEGWI